MPNTDALSVRQHPTHLTWEHDANCPIRLPSGYFYRLNSNTCDINAACFERWHGACYISLEPQTQMLTNPTNPTTF